MKIVFSLTHSGFVRNYEGTLRWLADRGHEIHVTYTDKRNKLGEQKTLEKIIHDYPNVTRGLAPGTVFRKGTSVVASIRTSQDYLRYLSPTYHDATKLRTRVQDRTTRLGRFLGFIVSIFGEWSRRLFVSLLSSWDRAIPVGTDTLDFFKQQKPDVLLLTPLIDVGSSQVEHIKAARVLGIPTALCVASWDNLTNKGLIRQLPDKIFVWNQSQKEEAVNLHGASPDQVVITGAQIFDFWFSMDVRASRDEFYQRVRLNPSHPFILYIGSSIFIAPGEAEFALKWIARLRTSRDPLLRDAGVLIRPHPTNMRQWRVFEQGVDLDSSTSQEARLSGDAEEPEGLVRNLKKLRFQNVAFWPRLESIPRERRDSRWDFFNTQNKEDYFHSIYHSSVVTGINSSGMIEAGIVGKSVCTLLAPEFATGQGGTIHFQHLLTTGGGLLHTAKSVDDFLLLLRDKLSENNQNDPKSSAFTKHFIRPRGIDTDASPILGREIEKIPSEKSAVSQSVFLFKYPGQVIAMLMHWILFPFALHNMSRTTSTINRRVPYALEARIISHVLHPFLFVLVHVLIPVGLLWDASSSAFRFFSLYVKRFRNHVQRGVRITLKRLTRLSRTLVKHSSRLSRIILKRWRRFVLSPLRRLSRIILKRLRKYFLSPFLLLLRAFRRRVSLMNKKLLKNLNRTARIGRKVVKAGRKIVKRSIHMLKRILKRLLYLIRRLWHLIHCIVVRTNKDKESTVSNRDLTRL